MWRKLALLSCVALRVFAQGTNTKATSGPWTAELNGVWRWHSGDNMQWASPSFDDSSWAQLKLPAAAPKELRYWIRIPVELAPVSDPGLLLGPIAHEYEAYWDGKQVGRFGHIGPNTIAPLWQVFHLPAPASLGLHLIALRIWGGSGKNALRPPRIRVEENRIGNFALLKEIERAVRSADFYSQIPDFLMMGAYFLIGVFFLLLARSMALGSAFYWFGLSSVAGALGRIFAVFTQYDTNGSLGLLGSVLGSIGLAAAIEFAYAMYSRRIPIGIRIFQLLLVAFPLLRFTVTFYALIIPVFWVVACLVPIPMLWNAHRSRASGAGMIAFLFGLLACAYFIGLALPGAGLIAPLHIAGFQTSSTSLARLLFVPAVALQIHKMNLRLQNEQQRLRGEMQAARQVQEILLPSKIVQVPGFEIDAVYQPATEVGGDFFQLFPAADDSLLVVVGDVSGKGMKAALLVSLIVGALQNRKSDQPASILSELNSALLGRSEGGFTTCCCALFAPDGALTLANAGHLAPYRNGKDIETAPGLPLGVMPSASWDEMQIALEPGHRIVWMSDGIVEARNGKRDLLGFTRAQELADRPVSEIARAAQEFGQEDDITVVSITRQPVPAYVA